MTNTGHNTNDNCLSATFREFLPVLLLPQVICTFGNIEHLERPPLIRILTSYMDGYCTMRWP